MVDMDLKKATMITYNDTPAENMNRINIEISFNALPIKRPINTETGLDNGKIRLEI